MNSIRCRFGFTQWSYPIFLAAVLLALLAVGPACRGEELPYGVSKAYSRAQDALWKAIPDKSRVPKEPGRAGSGEELVIEVINYDLWLTNQDAKARKGKPILFLDHMALPGLFLTDYSTEWVFDTKTAATNKITYFGVRLEQTDANHAVWKKLVRGPNFKLERPTEVSLGFEGGAPMNSWVYPTAPVGADYGNPFHLIILSHSKLYLGLVVIVGAFLIFQTLVRKTDLLRDPNQPLRPDGSLQFSLARTQMAFWFFLVFGSFFFLWLVSGDTDTLNSSTITLIGISAGTAVGSAFIDSGKRRILDQMVFTKKNAKAAPEELEARIKSDLLNKQAMLTETQQAKAALDPKNQPALDANEAVSTSLYKQIQTLEQQLEFFASPRWKTAMHDLLAENGVVSFHRFQMCVWTVVLGIIFVSDVYNKAAMPDFSTTLLGLMGVSAGTFIGFKLPNQIKG